jgi:glutathione S-transferase
MKLYYSPGVCSLSPHIVLREAGFPVELKRVDMQSKAVEGGGDYREVNPKGYVPALELENGDVLTEGPAIVQYIADLKPELRLAPPNGTLERYRLQEMLTFIGTEIHKFFTPFHYKAASEDWRGIAKGRLTQRFNFLNKHLENKDYLLGSQFTVADAYLFTTLTWTPRAGFDRSQWPSLDQYHNRVAARPKVQEAMRAERLIK